MAYIVKCDECKRDIRETDDVRESYAGGTCDECRAYIQRRLAKAERFAGYAANANKSSAQAFGTANAIADMIPMGQPILVGHHSERGHRRDIARIDSNMRKGIDDGKDAKIAELEAERDHIKAVNKSIRMLGFTDATMTEADRRQLLELARLTPYVQPLQKGFPAYHLSNLNGNLRRYKQRREELASPARRVSLLLVKYSGECGTCGAPIAKGDTACYERTTKTLFCNQQACYQAH